MKKILSILLILMLIVCMVPNTVFAAKLQFTTIVSVSINEVSSPAANTEPLYHANIETSRCKIRNINDDYWQNGVTWFEKTSVDANGRQMTVGEKFKPGYYYMVRVSIETNSSSYFEMDSSDRYVEVEGTINGKTASVYGTDNTSAIVDYVFPTMCMTTIKTFDISITEPVADAKPSFAKITGTGYESNNSRNNASAFENGIYWYDVEAKEYLYPNTNATFEAGKKYKTRMILLATTGYKIASSVTVTINGKTVKSEDVTRVDNECISIDYTFTVPEKPHIHTESDWKTNSKNHWKVCTDKTCEAITTAKAAHTDSNKDNKCDVCSYKMSSGTTESSSKPTESSSKPTNTSSKPAESSSQPTESSSKPEDKSEIEAPTESKEETPSTSTDDKASSEIEDTNSDETTGTTGASGEESNSDTDKTGKKASIWIWIIIAAVILIGSNVTLIVILIKKKNKKQ